MSVKKLDIRRIITALKGSFDTILQTAGMIAATKYMVRTGASKRSKLAGVGVKANKTKLTWRTGRLAKSLMVKNNPEAIRSVEIKGEYILGKFGTKVPYAKWHEYGYRFGRRPFIAPTIKDKVFIESMRNIIKEKLKNK